MNNATCTKLPQHTTLNNMILGWNAVEASDFGEVRASLGLRLDRDILNCYFHQGAPDILFRHKVIDGIEAIIDVAAADVPAAAH